MEKLNALVAFLGSFGSIFDVGDFFVVILKKQKKIMESKNFNF
jgi:hypothetical protein